MRKYLLLILGSFSFVHLIAQPAINSFNPTSGPIGTNVTITGTNFNTTPSNNIVFFGAVKATVNAASATTLSVTVPAGASYRPITVTTNNLTCYSRQPFITTFPGGGGIIQQASFDIPFDSTTDLHPNDVVIVDLDGDGKPDLATSNDYSTTGQPATFSVLRNTSTGSAISFAARVDIPNCTLTSAIAVGDLDGDGKPDIVVSCIGEQDISVFRNTSTIGNISFAPKVSFVTGTNPNGIAIGDLDKDGKPDIAVSNFISGSISVFKNIGSLGSIAFNPKIDYIAVMGIESVAIGYINNDDLPDLVSVSQLSGSSMSVYLNTSTTGNISFAAPTTLATEITPFGIAIGDIDNDGINDIAIACHTTSNFNSKVSVFKNNSTGLALSLGTRVDYTTSQGMYGASMADLNGDGKIEIIAGADNPSVFTNQSSVGSINFAAPQYIGSYASMYNMRAGDLNGDGQPELISCHFIGTKISIYRNIVTEPAITSFTPASAAQGQTVTLTGLNFTGTTAVSFGGIPATSFTIVNATTITAVVGAGSSGNVLVTTSYATGIKTGFAFAHAPAITSFSPTSGSIGQTITITGTDFTSVTGVSFGGTPANYMVVSPTTITATLSNGASGDVSVTTGYGTGSLAGFTFLATPTVTSFTPVASSTGQSVTITGTNFTGTTAMKFGGAAAASFAVVSPTQLTAVVAAGASGDVSVTNADGTGILAGFTYIGPPGITSFTPPSGIPGTVITITGTNFINVTSVSVGGVQFNNGQYTVISPASIELTLNLSPPSGVDTIKVFTAQGTASIAGFIFYKIPSVTSISPDVAAPGMTITITGANFSGINSITLGGTAAASYTIVSSTVITAVVGGGSTGNLVITNPAGISVNNLPFRVSLAPVISSFTPNSGPIGTFVTITGGNFSTIPANNIVYFGAVKAQVVSSSALSMVVKVPYGTGYAPISITRPDLFLTAYSSKPFDVTFPGDSNAFNSSSFVGQLDLNIPAGSATPAIGDIDGDGKLDIVTINPADGSLIVFRNTSTGAAITFSQATATFEVGINSILTADIDGDGKLDIIGTKFNSFDQHVYILKNQSTTGNISFGTSLTISTFFNLYDQILVADLNQDGKPEIIGVDAHIGLEASGAVYFLVNSSTAGTISFSNSGSAGLVGNSSTNPNTVAGIKVVDMNNDGKPDIIAGTTRGTFFFLCKNQTQAGGFPIFASSTMIGLNNYGSYEDSGPLVYDYDGDGYMDVITRTRIYRNQGNLSFATQGNVITAMNLYRNDVADLDGDSKPDIVGDSIGANYNIHVDKNTSTSGNINFAPRFYYPSNAVDNNLTQAADIDNDGKPDLICFKTVANLISIFKNKVGIANICPGGGTSLASSINSGSSFQWQVNTGGGFVNISNNTNYAGTNTANLQLTNIPSTWYGYQFRCVVDGANSDIYVLQFYESWTGSVSTAWENPANWSCGVVPDSNTNVVLVNGTIVINSNVTINTLSINPGVNLTVTTGNNFIILH